MKIDVASELALETRRRLQVEARAIGVSEEYISRLVDEFYLKVRSHQELGPVFDEVVKDNWAIHLERMKVFWTSIALRTGTYRGNPLPKHKALVHAKPEHFEIWLSLFEETLLETAPNQQVVDFFLETAKSMGKRLSTARFS